MLFRHSTSHTTTTQGHDCEEGKGDGIMSQDNVYTWTLCHMACTSPEHFRLAHA